jgi:membrane protease subunit (stomatin/prohibitin family)
MKHPWQQHGEQLASILQQQEQRQQQQHALHHPFSAQPCQHQQQARRCLCKNLGVSQAAKPHASAPLLLKYACWLFALLLPHRRFICGCLALASLQL